MLRLRFRAPGRSLSARELLARALPELAAGARERLLHRGGLRRARVRALVWRPGLAVNSPEASIPPGAALWLEVEAALQDDAAGLGRAAALSAWLPALPWQSGEVSVKRGVFRFERLAERGQLGLLRFVLEGARPRDVLRWAARAGAPVLGDRRRGGVLVAGGLCLMRAECPPPAPMEPAFPPEAGRAAAAPRLRVSRASARALRSGHPWVLADDETEDVGRFPAGALVVAEAPSGTALGLVRVEGPGRIAARVWRLAGQEPGREDAVEMRVRKAVARRARFHAGAGSAASTDGYRLVHGEADGLPGLSADRLGSLLRVRMEGGCAQAILRRAVSALQRELTPWLGSEVPTVLVLQRADPPPGKLEGVRLAPGSRLPSGPLFVHEAGLRFRIDVGLALPERPRGGVGLFLDQRANRARLRSRIRPGGRYANLFCHTGAFSAGLLAEGAGEVWSVDLSGAYLRFLEESLRENQLLGEAHRSVRRDARRWLAEQPPARRFDGIILDPPTAAAAGREFWSVERGLGSLVMAALRRLTPGGWLLVCRNDRGRRGRVLEALGELADRAQAPLASLEPAPPAEDFPPLAGFPEGDPFDAALAIRA